ncbi:MAG: phenylalanine--tRNA ligase subunit beta [Gemmatimonadota bacterium]|nr:phenylalanine--tRNA ligase subunit beta [Gemmatimonadota bacterium]
MNVSYLWLRDFLPALDLEPRELADLLTARAATVEELESLRAELAPFVVARVVESQTIPDTKLTINKVDDGSSAFLDVVCGAPNVRVGALYPFARVGSTMPNGLKIEKRKIRGNSSNGMLCSARELGLGESHEGIMELDVEVPPGTPLLEALPIGDTRLVLDVLPNRPDLLSHLGVAREVAAATGAERRDNPVRDLLACYRPGPASGIVASPASNAREGSAGGIRVVLDDAEGSPRYLGAVLRRVRVGASPDWLRQRIESIGVRPINNVVDATNFMLHGFGQPMHAFDAARLGGPAVIVRRARRGETLVTLDGVTRTLDPEMTVIADADRAQAIAGVIGGRASEVTERTTDVFLEVAAFEPKRIRATRRALGFSTDASYRFERGVDVAACGDLLAVAAELIIAVAGGEVDGAPIDLYPDPSPPRVVPLRVSRVERVLGERISREEIVRLLGSIGLEVEREDEDALHLRVPSWRVDVEREIDLVEEVARLRGYDTFPDELRPFRPSAVPESPLEVTTRRVREALVAHGLLEARAMPFVRGADHGYVRVANPLAENEAYLRRDLLETLARRAEYNLAQMQRNVRLFEIGAAWAPATTRLPREEMRVAALITGDRRPPHWTDNATPAFDEWDAKWLAEVTAGAAYPGAEVELRPADGELLWTVTADDRDVGVVRRVPLDAPVWAAPAFGVELLLQVMDATPVGGPSSATRAHGRPGIDPAVAFSPLPTTPASGFDVALLVPNDVPAERVERSIAAASGTLLERLTLLSEYRGGSVPDGYRSLAWQLTLRHPERTLESKEIAGRRERLLRTLEGELGVRVR